MSQITRREVSENFTEFLVPLPCVIGDLEDLIVLARATGSEEGWDDEYKAYTDDEHLILRRLTTRSTTYARGQSS